MIHTINDMTLISGATRGTHRTQVHSPGGAIVISPGGAIDNSPGLQSGVSVETIIPSPGVAAHTRSTAPSGLMVTRASSTQHCAQILPPRSVTDESSSPLELGSARRHTRAPNPRGLKPAARLWETKRPLVTASLVLAFAILMVLPTVRADPPPPLPPDEQLADKLRAIAGEGSRIHETDHFTVCYDTTYDVLRPLIGRLEGTYDTVWRFCEKNSLPAHPPTARLEVILFDRQEDYLRYCASVGFSGGSSAGFYAYDTNIAVFANTLTRPELIQAAQEIERTQEELKRLGATRNKSAGVRARQDALRRQLGSLRGRRDAIVDRFNRLVLQHETAHQMFFNVGVHVRGADNPAWLAEGLACQLEIAQAGRDGKLRRVNQMRLADLRDAFGVPPNAKSISDADHHAALTSKRLIPLRALIGERGSFTRDPNMLIYRYGQAWGLVYYLSRTHRDALPLYLRRLSSRRPGQIAEPEEGWRPRARATPGASGFETVQSRRNRIAGAARMALITSDRSTASAFHPNNVLVPFVDIRIH